MYKIGIYGGTFNPIHFGHISIANEFIKKFEIDICEIFPTHISPFKTNDNNDFLDSFYRLEMLKLAFRDKTTFHINDFEVKSNQISYTYKTIEHVKELYPNAHLYLLIGSDQAINFHKWMNWDWITEEVALVIAERNQSIQSDFEFQKLRPLTNVLYLGNELIKISSSDIRERIRNNLDCSHLLPDSVLEFIQNNNLYRQ